MLRNPSSSKSALTPSNRKELSEWLAQQHLDIKTIHRESTDGILVAKLIKKFFPKTIDLYHYQESSQMKQKLANWQKLNDKVLSKLDLSQKLSEMQRFVRGENGVICNLLFDIMRLHKSNNKENLEEEAGGGDADERPEDREPVMMKFKRVVDGHTVRVKQNMISLKAYELSQEESKKCDEAIEVASKRIQELENRANIKSDEIDTLVKELALKTFNAMQEEVIVKELGVPDAMQEKVIVKEVGNNDEQRLEENDSNNDEVPEEKAADI